LRGKAHAGILQEETRRVGKRFEEAAAKFLEEAPILTQGQRGPTWLNQYELKLNGIILPFFGDKHLAEITSASFRNTASGGRRIARRAALRRGAQYTRKSSASLRY